MRVLFAEDEKDLNRIVSDKLKNEGYSVDSCLDGAEELDYLASAEYDLLILDIMMPKRDGFYVLTQYRRSGGAAPVLFLTARDSIEDRVRGLDSGANDYLVKPFSMEELLARVRALTRSSFGQVNNTLKVGDLEMDLSAHPVSREGRPITLSSKEFALLRYFMLNPGIVLSREKIEDHIWNFDYEGGTNVVDVYISYLRRKIDHGFAVKMLKTVRGAGYVLKDDHE